MPTLQSQSSSDPASELMQLFGDEAARAGFGIAAPCADHVKNLITAGLARAEREKLGSIAFRRAEIENNLRKLLAAMIAHAKKTQETELHEDSFFNSLQSLCPLWPFC